MSQGETTRINVWVARLQDGDQQALNELIAHFERRLRALTQKMIRDYPSVHRCEQTDDVFQKAVLRLCRALKAVSPGSTRDLFRLSAAQVRRELLNLARYYRSRPHLIPAGNPGPADRWTGDFTRSDADPFHGAAACEEGPNQLDQWTEFHEVAAGLPNAQREVFDLIWYQGMTQGEVARVQRVSVRTVKKRWNSARIAIFDALDGILPGA